jgi:hypothetical protein
LLAECSISEWQESSSTAAGNRAVQRRRIEQIRKTGSKPADELIRNFDGRAFSESSIARKTWGVDLLQSLVLLN